jgi:hypothetical protein
MHTSSGHLSRPSRPACTANRAFLAILTLLILWFVLPVRAIAQPQPPGGPTVTVTPGDTLINSSNTSATLNVSIVWCSSVMMVDATRSITLDGVDVRPSFTTTNGGVNGCVYGARSNGSVLLTTSNDGNHTFQASIEDVNSNQGFSIKHYKLRWPGRTTPKYAVEVSQAVHTIDVQTGANRTTAFTVSNRGSRPATYTLSAHCLRAATPSSCSSVSPTSVVLDTTAQGRNASATVTFTAGAAGDTGTVTLIARNASLSADVDSASTDIMIPVSTPSNPAGVVLAGSGDVVARDLCLTIAIGADAAYECGDLRLVHALPAVTTRGKARVPVLLYNSAHALANAVVAADVTPVASRGVPNQVAATVSIGGQIHGSGQWTGSQWTAGSTRRVTVRIDSAFATGLYDYTLDVAYTWSDASVTHDIQTGRLSIVNRSASPFGAGWWIAGVEQLVARGSDFLWVGGDGSTASERDPDRIQQQRSARNHTSVGGTGDHVQLLRRITRRHRHTDDRHEHRRALHLLVLHGFGRSAVARPEHGTAHDCTEDDWERERCS